MHDVSPENTNHKVQVRGLCRLHCEEDIESHSSNIACRICMEPGGERFCNCKGSTGYVHRHCLTKWLKVSNRDECEICNYTFKVEITRNTKPYQCCSTRDFFQSNDIEIATVSIIAALSGFVTSLVFGIITREYLACLIMVNGFQLIIMCAILEKARLHNVALLWSTLNALSIILAMLPPLIMNEPVDATAVQIQLSIWILSLLIWCVVTIHTRIYVSLRTIMVSERNVIVQNVDTASDSESNQV